MFPLEAHTLFVTLAGSQAHGTAREGSDVDLRGVCIAPLAVRVSLFSTFEQHEGPLGDVLMAAIEPRLRAHPTAARALDVKTECVVFDVAKMVFLCAQANPNALEILFADERDWVFETPAWRTLHEQRALFLTSKVQQTFQNYAMAQLRKIKSHRAWLLSPPAHKPTRADFGLPPTRDAVTRDDQNRIEESIAAKLRSYALDDIEMPKAARLAVRERMEALAGDVLAVPREEIEERVRAVATTATGIPLDVIATLNAERKHRAAMRHWESYESWKRERNPARAELERKFGYDTKHAMHLIRLMRMGREILAEGVLRVRRPDADELRSIRDGALSFDALLDSAALLEADMKRAAATTQLPRDVDVARVDALLFELIASAQR
jgi:predicted nucleotidyltransferase